MVNHPLSKALFPGVPVAPVGPLDSHDVRSDFQFDGWGVER